MLLTIPAAKTVPLSFAWERYIRIGSSKENLRKYPEKESYLFDVLRYGRPTLENTPSEYQDLTFEKLMIYYGAKGIKLNPDTYKRNLSLYTEDGKYNLLAQLLSDNSHMPVRVAIFSGRTKADNMYSVREFGYQCLLYSLDDVLRYGDVLNIFFNIFKSGSLTSLSQFDSACRVTFNSPASSSCVIPNCVRR